METLSDPPTANPKYPPQLAPKNLHQFTRDSAEECHASAGIPDACRTRIEWGKPVELQCTSCKYEGLSEVKKRMGETAWTVCVILCCFCFPLCFLPFILQPCKDSYHYCSRCGKLLYVKPP